jgi:hypothetical protein
VQVFRFPHHLCFDNGRAINQAEPGWENTLTGIPKEIYEFWKRRLQPEGYHIRYEVSDYPGGVAARTSGVSQQASAALV